jgi:hypothetical protein
MRIYQEYGSHVATLGDDAVVRVGEARRSWRQAAEAARLASSDQFSGEPLPGVGSDPWRRLFIAAREYSIERAYVHERFPNVQPNSRCVLCMQPLDDIARDRLSRFQRFIEDKTASEAERAKRTFAELVEAIRRVPIAAPEATLIEEVRLRDETAAAEMAGFAESAAARKVALLSAIEQESDLQVPDLQGQDAVPLVRALCDRLEADARVIDAAANPTALARMTARRGELVARRALAAKLDIVLDHLRRLQTAGRLDSLAGALKSQPVSMKGRALADQAVTDALRTAFQTELRIFGAEDLVSVVDLRQTVVKGQSHHQLLLPHSTRAAGPAKVLSEGEQCVIAIASFLAELSISPVRAGIIFDDPVSSLDHRWRDKIAERLVAQAKDRQVIVFTHNIMFLYAVDRLATLGQVPLHVECLQRSTHGIGVCGPRPPWDTLNIKQRMDRLDEILQRARTAFDREPDGSEYAHLASEFFDGLRATWERCVEERLLGGVVTRFDIAVHTQALSRVVVEDQDYVDVHRGMTEASAGIRAHDAPAAEQRAPVAPDALDGCLSRLRDFVARLGKRADGVAHMRKALTKPPAATVPA